MTTISIATPATGSTLSPVETAIDLFGVDIKFEDDIPVNASGDYVTVEGFLALRQAILIRLITAPGEYAIRPDFGCGIGQWLKKRMTKSERDNLRQTIIEQLSQEERIQKVEEVTVEALTSGDTTGVKISVRVTALGRENNFAFTNFSE